MVNSLTTMINIIKKYNLMYLLKFKTVCTLLFAIKFFFQFCLKLTSMVRPSDRNSLMYINIFAKVEINIILHLHLLI